jgi:ribosomal protein S12 methylthiotransferase
MEARLVPGQFVDVEILGSDEHDLYGEALMETMA